MNAVHLIVPDSIDDAARPSGGNVYDRKISVGLAAIGWSVHMHAVPGDWPVPDPRARRSLSVTLNAIPDNAVVLIDGLIASAATDLPVFARRLRVVVLVHMPVAGGPVSPHGSTRHRSTQVPVESAETRAVERAALSAAARVVTTSGWTKRWLVEQYALEPGRIHVVEPGTDSAEPALEATGGSRLLCVAAVTPVKGHDLLVAALAQIADLPWDCVCVGPVDRDSAFVARLRLQTLEAGIADRIRLVGPRTGEALDATYAAADVVVVCSRYETYGMVITEALARAIPVIAAAVGGAPEALTGSTLEDGTLERRDIHTVLPGILVPTDNASALAAALRRWIIDPDLRLRLRRAALQRRGELPSWARAADQLSDVLVEAGA